MSSTAPLVRVEVPEALDKWKSWAKLLQRVDTSRKDGYAFEGPWLRRGRLDELPGAAPAHIGRAAHQDRWSHAPARDPLLRRR